MHEIQGAKSFTWLMILTQSCDLVNRENKKGHVIQLAGARTAEDVLSEVLERICDQVSSGIFHEKTRNKFELCFERITNQNEQDLGMFYLHEESKYSITGSHIVELRKAFYLPDGCESVLRKARSARLRPEFASKLGWLVGNLYSRVATTDWHEVEIIPPALDALRRNIPSRVNWVKALTIKHLEAEGFDPSSMNWTDIEAALKRNPIQKGRHIVVEQVKQVLQDVGISSSEVDKVVRRLPSDNRFLTALNQIKGEREV